MPSSYTASARYTLQATGEGTNVWGTILNNGAFALVDFNVNGTVTISSSGATTLTTVNGAADQARAAILNYTGSTAGVLTIPSVSKVYQVRNPSAQLTITNGSSSLVLVAGDSATVMTDGTTIWKVQSADFAGRKITSIATPTTNFDAATKKYVDDTAFSSITNLPGQAGNAGKFLSTDGANASWQDALSSFVVKTTTYTAVAGDRIFADTTGGAFTITLPASPSTGDEIFIADGGVTPSTAGWAGNNLTIDRNGSTLGGVAQNMTCRTRGAAFRLTYESSNWKVTL